MCSLQFSSCLCIFNKFPFSVLLFILAQSHFAPSLIQYSPFAWQNQYSRCEYARDFSISCPCVVCRKWAFETYAFLTIYPSSRDGRSSAWVAGTGQRGLGLKFLLWLPFQGALANSTANVPMATPARAGDSHHRSLRQSR